MKNLQKDSPGLQLLQQFSCQTVIATGRVSIRRHVRAFCKVYRSDPLTQRNDDNFVAPNVSQSASLSYTSSRGLGHYPKMLRLRRGTLVPGLVLFFSEGHRPICTPG